MIVRLLKRLAGDRAGGTAIEYGLIAALIVITMVTALVNLADTTVGMWGNINTKVTNARGG
ncbi:Flp family type IVb pilin [Sphingomonas sp. RB3P16]|uniref:Flp family type IVb pilin n=1 Tax=Parasphingomonas frigoris TaxID=3096163 RepID=UPI002FCA49FF